MKVYLNNNQETIILIHTEIVSLAVLGDEQENWRPTSYNYSRWGCQLKLDFSIIKLLDYQNNYSSLVNNNNPFAVVIMAYL